MLQSLKLFLNISFSMLACVLSISALAVSINMSLSVCLSSQWSFLTVCLSFYGLFGLVWLSACSSVCRWQLDQRLPQVCRAVGHPEIVIPIILDWVFAISIKLGSGMPLIGQSKPNDRNNARPKNLGGKKSVIGVAQLVPVTRS